MWIDLETVIQSEVSQKEKNKYCILTHICGISKKEIGFDEPEFAVFGMDASHIFRHSVLAGITSVRGTPSNGGD